MIFRIVFTSVPPPVSHWGQRWLGFIEKTAACSCSQPIHQPSAVGPRQLAHNVELCHRLRDMTESDHCLGTVSYRNNFYHMNGYSDYRDMNLSLEDLISGPILPTRRSRYHLALLLASSVAQLQFSPWLLRGVSRTDILFFPPFDLKPESVNRMHREPFIRQGFPTADATDLHNENPDRWAFHSLGIRLLELCFGKTVESHDPKVLKVPEAERFIASIMVAKVWAGSVEEEAGQAYSKAVKWCLADGGNEFLIETDSWRDGMIKNVVLPLHTGYGNIFEKWEDSQET